MVKPTGMLIALVAGCTFLPAQQQPAHKELTARELFYTAAASPPAPKSPPPAAATSAKANTRPASAAPQVARTESPKPDKKTVVAHSTPPTRSTPPATPDGTPVVAAAVRHTAPPPSSGQPLGLRYIITKLVDGKMVEVPADGPFQAGDRIRITVVTNSPGYLYIINQGSSGTWKPIFPSADVEDGNNRVEPFHDYVMPPKSRMVFDSQPGVEKLFVVLSREPENDLEQMIYSLQKPSKASPDAAEPEPAKPAPTTLVAANISDDMVGHMRNVYARDLVIEKVDESTPGDRHEKAVYVVNPTGSADSRVVADIALAHQ